MEKVILSKRNCHRADLVQSIVHPEWGKLKFNYMEYRLPNNRLAHTIGCGSNSKMLCECEFINFEVVDWKYPVSLEEYWDLAYNAYYWTSFDPDKAGERTIIEYEKRLNDDLVNIPTEEQERYITNYKKYFSSWLTAHSKCASTAITGGANFNVRKNDKAFNREQASLGEFVQWREKALRSIAKRIEDNKPDSVKRAEIRKSLEEDIRDTAATIEGINNGTECCNKQLIVSNFYNRVETFAKHGDVEMVDFAVSLIRELNQYSNIITERHKFFKLPELASSIKEKMSDMNNAANKEIPFDGGKVIKNFSENRIQIVFDNKPEQEVISKLKSHGFHWSPRFKAWQRQLTTNSLYAVSRVINIEFNSLK